MAALPEPRTPGSGAADARRAAVLRAVHRSPGAVLAAGEGYLEAHLARLHPGAVRGSGRAHRLSLPGAPITAPPGALASDIIAACDTSQSCSRLWRARPLRHLNTPAN